MEPSGSSKLNAKVLISTAVSTFLSYVVLAVVLNAPGGCALISTSGRTLHFPEHTFENKQRDGISIIDASAVRSRFEKDIRFWNDKSRSKRAADDPVDPNNLTTVAVLNDTHTTLMVHWAGEGSDVIMALAKSTGQPNSALFLSRDYGKSFTDVSAQLMVDWSRKAVINNYYNARSFNNFYVFTDETNNCMFTTDDTGENFVRHCDLSFSPRIVKLNLVNPRNILAMDDQSQMKQLYLSENFGETWRAVYSHVKSFHWGVPPYDSPSTIFVVESLPSPTGQDSGKLQVVKSNSLFKYSYDTNVILTDVVDFEFKDEFMYATKSVNLLGSLTNPHIQFWVSYKRKDFVNAQFPGNNVFTDFYVADASEGQLMVCAHINNSYSNLYVSDVTGYKFTLSLKRVVYFNPKTIRNRFWTMFYANESFADITKIHGVSGIYIASQQLNDSLEVDEQQTVITYDKGGRWEILKAPEYTITNLPSKCTVANNCSLHLTQEFHRLYPGSRTPSILSQRSSPGLVIASGILGETLTLKGDPDVFLSTNAGISWRQVLSGSYFYATNDHGGIIMAVHKVMPTNKVVYSIDEGETWHSYRIVNQQIRVYGLLTEPGENSTVFSVFGSPLGPLNWQIIQVDFKNIFNGMKCGPSDYKMWSVSDELPNGTGCLLGHVTMYQRRRANALCYNGDNFVRQMDISNCSCKREDFECDFGFEDNQGICQPDPSVRATDVYQVPSNCQPGMFYSYTRGYRKIVEDTCVGGEEHRLGPLKYSCPIPERSEFLLITQESGVKMIDLANKAQDRLLEGQVSQVPPVFDYKMNCLIYVDVSGDVKRSCYAPRNTSIISHEIIHRKQGYLNVVSMAFDWTGRNIYCTNSGNAIHVVNLDGRFERTLYNISHGVISPRAITVDPQHGYLFFVGENPSTKNFNIFKAAMDGSSSLVEVLIQEHVSNNTFITLDMVTESIYWVNSDSGTGYKAGIHEKSVSKLFQVPPTYLYPSSIGIYKNDLFVSSKSEVGILMKSKNNPDSSWHYFDWAFYVSSLAVVSNTSQHATSACSSQHHNCSQLCLPHPSLNTQNRTCLCGDGYNRMLQPPSLDEKCSCNNGEIMKRNGSCIKSTNISSCSPTKLTCNNGNCVLLTWKCDGEDDCGDGTDEIDCPYKLCNDSTQFTCNNGKCIPKKWMCDRQDDCNDGFSSDELNCHNQSCDQFQCDNGYCINKHWRCDLDDDCHDGSDERGCNNKTTCSPWSFTCDNGACIDIMYKCNGLKDCEDSSDEVNCINTNCSPDWQFDCGQNNGCIIKSWRCDGEHDCKNDADEFGCNLTTTSTTTSPPWIYNCSFMSFTCKNKICIGFENVCNNVNDCGDWSDETDCGYHIINTTTVPVYSCEEKTEFFCEADHKCLPAKVRCDWHEDCSDGTDEENCETDCDVNSLEWFQCSGGKCIWKQWVCDHELDCPSGDDEVLCGNFSTCQSSNEFQCMSGACVPKSMHCDKSLDCDDGSDENGCNYTGGVICSTFNKVKDVCCSIPQCGVYTTPFWFSEGGQCKSSNESTDVSENTCERHTPDVYQCKADQFKCSDTQDACVSFVQVCDNRMDCSNGKDEQSCHACMKPDLMPVAVYSKTDTSISWKINFNFTQLSYAENVPYLPLANFTWKNLTSLSILKGLKAYTAYYLAFLQQSQGSSCVLRKDVITTLEGIPSAPRNLTANVRIENNPLKYSVDLSWQKPDHPNGDILLYTIYYQKNDGKGNILSGMTQIHRFTLETITISDSVLNVQPNRMYDFWVTATTSAGEGPPTQKSTVHVDAIPDEDLNLTANILSNTSLKLAWAKATTAVGYQVIVQFPQMSDFPPGILSDLVVSVNNSQTSYVVTGLCPGSTIHVGMKAKYNNNLQGPMIRPSNKSQIGGEIKMPGTTPKAAFVLPAQVESDVVVLNYNLTQGVSSVKQYYIYYKHGQSTEVLNVTTDQMSYGLYHLFPCQEYTAWIRPAYPTCPISDIIPNFYTKEDIKAPPMNVNLDVKLDVSQGNYHYSLNISWNPSCPDKSGIPESYIIHVKRGDKEQYDVKQPKRELFFPYVYDGTNYTFTVRVNGAGSKESEPKTISIPYLGKPINLKWAFNGGKNITIAWYFPPAQDKKNKFQNFVVHLVSDKKNVTRNTTEPEISLLLSAHGEYFVTVTAVAQDGHIIGEPGSQTFVFEPDVKEPDVKAEISISTTNLVKILVPVALVMVGLSAALVIFIVRHKRLQRSFLAFANSHYNIQSGTTTFSEDLGLDGDEPLIQGFSDDEPLVIA